MRCELVIQALLICGGVVCCWLLPRRDRLAFLLAVVRRGQGSGPTAAEVAQGE